MTARDVVCISSIDWSFLWQVHQEVAVRFARAGCSVFYIENTGIRSPSPADAGRVASRLGNWARAGLSRGWRTVAPSIVAHAPIVLPPFGGPLRRALNRTLLLPRVSRGARRAGLGEERLIITYLPTDTAIDLAHLFENPRSVLVYYCLADFGRLTPHASALAESERDLVRRADLVLANSTRMVEHCRRWRDEVHLMPPGIDLAAFPERGAALHTGDDTLMSALARPIIGYVGGLHRLVDYRLIADAARARPSWTWVLVGPPSADHTALAGLPNVRRLGPRTHAHLASLIERFDVGVVPYLCGDATASIVPVKLNEYLAMGRPVASTALPSVEELAQRHPVVQVAGPEPGAFVAAIERALAEPDDAAARRRRRELAARCDWDAQFAWMTTLIEAAFRWRATAPASVQPR